MSKNKITDVKYKLPGPKARKYLKISRQYEAQCAGYQAQTVWESARGVVVTDVDGNRFIDWTSGVLVTNVGHTHPVHVKAIQQAVSKLMNCYDFPTPARVELARKLIKIVPEHLDKVFFLTTGSEATEAAIRVAKRYTGRFEILSFYGGFHGRTYAAMSAGGLSVIKKQFGPLMSGVILGPYPYCYRCLYNMKPETCRLFCIEHLNDIVRYSSTSSLAGLIIEPYQGAAGFIFPPKGYLKALQKWAYSKGIIFILDEVQSSFGRTGKMFAMEHENLEPDLVAIGKGIGSGIPLSALLSKSKVIGAIGKGEMSSTSGGNPVSCMAGIAVIDIIEREKLIENSNRIGKILKERLLNIQPKCRYLGDVRGMGMVIGLEFVKNKKTKEPAPDITRAVIDRAAQAGILVGAVGIYGNVIRVAPPLVITEDEVAESLDIMEKVLTSLK